MVMTAWNAALVAGAAYVTVIAACMLVLPAVNEVPADFSATTLWRFRLASLGTEAVLWTSLGVAFGALAEKQVGAAGRSKGRVTEGIR
jgi:hypothetical protein